MRDYGEKGKFKLSDLILIALLVGLIYVIYLVLGGNLSSFTNLSSSAGGGPVEQITDSLRSLGDGIAKTFSTILP